MGKLPLRVILTWTATILVGYFLLTPLKWMDLGFPCMMDKSKAEASTLKVALETYRIDHHGQLPQSWRDLQYLFSDDSDLDSQYGFGVSSRFSPLLHGGDLFLVAKTLNPASEFRAEGRYVFSKTPDGTLKASFLDREQSRQVFEETGFQYFAIGDGAIGTIPVPPDPVSSWAKVLTTSLCLILLVAAILWVARSTRKKKLGMAPPFSQSC